jgi:hypothetical protein
MTWFFRNFTAQEGTQGVVNFLNAAARQGPGEASAIARNDGSVGLFYFSPGSLGIAWVRPPSRRGRSATSPLKRARRAQRIS